MKSKNVECPKCFGAGEEFIKETKIQECSLCKGKGDVHSDLSEDYIASINVIHTHDDDFFDN